MKSILLFFAFIRITGFGQTEIPLGTYDLVYLTQGEQLIFEKGNPKIIHDLLEIKDGIQGKFVDSLTLHFQSLYENSSLHFYNEQLFFWHSLKKDGEEWYNETKGCAYQIDEETNRVMMSIPSSPGFSSSELYLFHLNGDSLILNPLQGTSGKGIYIKRSDESFKQPWKTSKPTIIIDAFGPNAINWNELQKDSNVIAIIHKCSEGLVADKSYLERSEKAKEMGYLWGSYHLGRSGDPIEQAKFYLSQIADIENDLIALDLEDVEDQKMMNLENALIFIDFIRGETGRYPLLYCNNNVLNLIAEQYGDTSSFSKCPLWYARFKSEVSDFNVKTWNTYTFWQFSCEINCNKTGECLYNVPGTAFDMDVNIFNGSQEELKLLWPFKFR